MFAIALELSPRPTSRSILLAIDGGLSPTGRSSCKAMSTLRRSTTSRRRLSCAMALSIARGCSYVKFLVVMRILPMVVEADAAQWRGVQERGGRWMIMGSDWARG